MSVILQVRSIGPSRIAFFAALAVIAAGPAFADVVVPSSAFSSGKNSAEFHSDVRVFNPTNSPVNFTPIFYRSDAAGNVVDTVQMPVVTIGPREQLAYDNVLEALFAQSIGVFGPIRFQTADALLVSSGVNNVNGCGNGSVSGQWLPGIDVNAALKAGTLVQLAASANAATGYRTNLDFMDPGATAANVTVKIRKGDGTQLSSGTISVGENGLVQKALDDGGTFPGVAGTTDTNLWVEFTSDQPVLAFASVINNASGDPFAIVMTAEPNVSSPVPVASYTVSASPKAAQPVTFTDMSSNSPVKRFWAFGDGAVAVNGGAAVPHTYGAAGTYHTALFVDNASGSSSATMDVVVVAVAPIVLAVSATTTNNTHWTFTPNVVTCRVNVPCQITWTTPRSENNHHGLGGLGVFGVTQCDDGGSLDNVIPSHACTVTFTPTPDSLNNQPVGGWVYACTQSSCGPGHNGMTGTIVIAP